MSNGELQHLVINEAIDELRVCIKYTFMTNPVTNSNPLLGDGGVYRGVNRLFPVFFKLEQLRVLLIGGGNVALEKLQAIQNNAPATSVTVIAREVFENFAEYAKQFSNVVIHTRDYQPEDLDHCDLVIAAVNDIPTSEIIRNDAKQKGKLINVADKPELCDFYLGSIVTKGNLKIAISTNGKSPTVAKRLREMFTELLPDEMEEVLQNMQQIRDRLKGDFTTKVEKLNEITRALLNEKQTGTP